MLVKCITPICNIQRDLWNNIHDVLNNKKLPSEKEKEFDEGVVRSLFDHHINTIAFDDFDPRKKEEAKLFIYNEKIKFIESNGQHLFIKVQCDAKNPEYFPDNENMDYYVVCLSPFISCHCFSFLLRGGACSHIRAAINIVNWMREQPRTKTFFDNLEHWEMPFIQLDSRQEALKKLHGQKFRKVFPLQSDHSMEDLDYENDSDSEDEDVDFFDPYVTRLDNWAGTNSISDSTLTEKPVKSSFTINDSNSLIRDKVIQSWNNDQSFAINRLIANMNDLVMISEKLGHNQANTPEDISKELKILDRELLERLNTLINCDKSKELVKTLWKMRQKLDSITNSRPDI
jgi:hypothetical protein